MCTLMSLCEVPANESSVLVGGLDRDTSYSVTVMAVNCENEAGSTSAPVIATSKIIKVITGEILTSWWGEHIYELA